MHSPTPSAHVCTPPAQGNFTHTPRPALVPTTKGHTYQRRYGPGVFPCDYELRPKDSEANEMTAMVSVFRDGGEDKAEVRIALGIFTAASIAVRLDAAELRELASRLLDASHDIETLPATVLALEQQGGAA